MSKAIVHAAKTPRSQSVPATEYKFGSSNERMVASNGEINASDKKDLLKQQMKFLQASSSGALHAQDQNQVKESQALVEAAFNDSKQHRLLGERMTDALSLAANRQGFMRKFMSRVDVAQGSVPRFSVRMKNVTSVYNTSPTKVQHQIIVDKFYYPPEMTILSRPFIPQTELNQAPGDILQDKFIEAQEATMVAEDRLWYRQANDLVGVDNNLNIISGQLTPYALMASRASVDRWGLKSLHILIASDLYQDIIGNADFYQAIDPVARHELLLTGELGTMYGMTITSDAYRHPEHKVLNKGEFFVISDALNHGAYSDRTGLQSRPIDVSTEGVPGMGWVVWEPLALSIANSRSIAKGVRL